jgi:hypothetical protein
MQMTGAQPSKRRSPSGQPGQDSAPEAVFDAPVQLARDPLPALPASRPCRDMPALPEVGTISPGVFTPVLAHSKSLSLVGAIALGVDRVQRNFEPMRKQVEAWRQSELMDVTAKIIIYQAFIEGELDVPKHLARRVHDLYFEPAFEEFNPRTVWSLSNAFTSAFKELDPIP